MIQTLMLWLLVVLFVLNGLNVVLIYLNHSKKSMFVLGIIRMFFVFLAAIFVFYDMVLLMSISIIIYLGLSIFMMGVEKL